jgi:hypothetical protein
VKVGNIHTYLLCYSRQHDKYSGNILNADKIHVGMYLTYLIYCTHNRMQSIKFIHIYVILFEAMSAKESEENVF